jgi:hypothetical protein
MMYMEADNGGGGGGGPRHEPRTMAQMWEQEEARLMDHSLCERLVFKELFCRGVIHMLAEFIRMCDLRFSPEEMNAHVSKLCAESSEWMENEHKRALLGLVVSMLQRGPRERRD